MEGHGWEWIDPDEGKKKRVRLDDSFNDYIEDAFKRNALEARSQAILVSAEFLAGTKTTFVDQVERETILSFDQRLRDEGREARTIFNKRQRLQSMLRWAGVEVIKNGQAHGAPRKDYVRSLP